MVFTPSLSALPDASRLPAPLLLAGLFSLSLIAPTLALLALDGRVLDDEALWLKPLKFQISMALLCLTVWLGARAAPPAVRSSLWLRLPMAAIAVTASYELLFLGLQAARGVRSHFNRDTAFDAAGGALMAAGANVLVLGAMLVGLVILGAQARAGWRALLQPMPLAWGLGLVLSGFLGGWTGSFIGMNRGPFVGMVDPQAAIVPLFGWSLAVGDLRIAHFLGLHAMQALPLAGLALSRTLPAPGASLGVLGVAAGWLWLTFHALAAALSGRPPFSL